jgi:hypothetical protein
LAFQKLAIVLGDLDAPCAAFRGQPLLLHEACLKISDRLVRIQSELGGVRTDERAAENAAGKTRQIIPLEGLERGDRNLRTLCDISEWEAAILSRALQPWPELIHRKGGVTLADASVVPIDGSRIHQVPSAIAVRSVWTARTGPTASGDKPSGRNMLMPATPAAP